MLYDPKWQQTKTDPFTLESLITWLEMQPADRAYNWGDCNGKCLLGQYFTARDLDWQRAYLSSPSDGALVSVAIQKPCTFGAALKRARKALAESTP